VTRKPSATRCRASFGDRTVRFSVSTCQNDYSRLPRMPERHGGVRATLEVSPRDGLVCASSARSHMCEIGPDIAGAFRRQVRLEIKAT
jgi:hypothetical protein